ncbi:MAG: hypothetical protein Q9223_001691 [Gallowayella weberi]
MQRMSPFSWLRCGLSTYTGAANLPQLFASNLAQAYFAHYYAVPEMMAVAQAQYGKHLLILKDLLDSPSMVNTNQLVQGIMIMLIFAYLIPTAPNAGNVHTSALANIVESWGLHQYRSTLDVSGLNLCRTVITCNAMQRRKRTFFEEPKWMNVGTWLLTDTLVCKLMDAHVVLPGLLEDFDNLCSSNVSPKVWFQKHELLKHRTIELINLHFTWRWEWERQSTDQVWAIPCPPTSHVPRDECTGEPLYPTLFRFSKFVNTAEICRYNGALATLFHLAHDIWGDNSYLNLLDRFMPPDMVHPVRRSPLYLPSDPGLGLRTVAAEHIRSIEIALSHETHLSSRGLILLLSLSQTYRVLSAGDPLKDWIRRMCGRSEKVGGPKTGREWKLEQSHWKRCFVDAEVR